MELENTFFVLVHDAWHGAWFWDGVINWLAQRDGRAIALDLPGHGALYQPEEISGDYTLAKYAGAVEEFVRQHRAEAQNVILVGQGMAGPVVQLAAEQLANELAGIIFSGAYILNHGETIASQMPPEMSEVFRQIAESRADKRISMELLADYWQFNLMNDEPRRSDEVLGRLNPEPLAPLFEPISLKPDVSLPPRAYISFNEDLSLPPGEFYPRMARKLGPHRHLTVNAGHEGPLTKPREVAEALIFLGLSGK